jgi:cystathionine beta-synthase
MGLALVILSRDISWFASCQINNPKRKWISFALLAKVVCPTDVEPTDPRSYYSVSKRLAEETPNSWYVNQYDNPSNAIAHYESTGPEIWDWR